MKNLNLHNLKSIFSKKEEPTAQSPSELDVDNPYLNYSIVIRGVSQLELLDEVYMNTNPEEYPKVRDRVKLRQFDFIYNILTKVPLENDKDVIEFILKDLGKAEVLTNLNKIMNHFIEIEEYEKCANIQKYLQKVEKKLHLPVDL
jgi:hypothetical protein